jgi:hypothetical protein
MLGTLFHQGPWASTRSIDPLAEPPSNSPQSAAEEGVRTRVCRESFEFKSPEQSRWLAILPLLGCQLVKCDGLSIC